MLADEDLFMKDMARMEKLLQKNLQALRKQHDKDWIQLRNFLQQEGNNLQFRFESNQEGQHFQNMVFSEGNYIYKLKIENDSNPHATVTQKDGDAVYEGTLPPLDDDAAWLEVPSDVRQKLRELAKHMLLENKLTPAETEQPKETEI